MLKQFIYIVLLFVAVVSCRRNSGNSTAAQICNCYDSIHDESVKTDNEADLEAKVQSCNLLLTKALDSFGEDEEGRALFMKSYRECQEK